MYAERTTPLFLATTKSERLSTRRRIFAQQDGLALVPVLSAFVRRGVFDALRGGISVPDLARRFAIRRGYLNLALRALASSGWLDGWMAPQTREDLERTDHVKLTPAGSVVADLLCAIAPTLDLVERFLAVSECLEGYLTTRRTLPEGAPTIADYCEVLRADFRLPQVPPDQAPLRQRLVRLLEGPLAAPLAVTLARHGFVAIAGSAQDTTVSEELRRPRVPSICHRRFSDDGIPAMRALGWLASDTDRLTAEGMTTVFFAAAYAVTLSYLPLLRRTEDLLFNGTTFATAFPPTPTGHETHVDRRLNIWGSGGAHVLYFSRVDEIIASIFRKDDYPRAVCDTGCGDGTFLRHIAEVLRDDLAWDFFRRPIAFIGADLNLASRDRTRETLAAGGVPNAYVVDAPIDIADPEALDAGIRRLRIPCGERVLTANDCLHTNSMLVHNRVWRRADGAPPSETDGAYVEPGGDVVTGRELAADLVGFMSRWSPYVQRFGWLFIELHTLPSAVVAMDPDRTPTIGYDLTHGLSNQYTVERREMLRCADLAGLQLGPAEHQALFPSGSLARVSVTFLEATP